jgi:DNA-directed RNA polymerase III subunit RPC3
MEFDDKDKTLRAGLKLPEGTRPSNAALVKEYFGILSFADNPTPAGTASAFISMKGGNKAQVEFETIGRRLRIRMLESATRDRNGEDGLRVLRLLIEKGKMDEKQASFFLTTWSSIILVLILTPILL